MRSLVLLLLTLILMCTSGAGRPHVLFIAVDDLNDWIGCLEGHPQALTPNMDRLAARGILFTNAHCVSPACNPSRAAVFSGRMPDVTGVWSNQSGSLSRRYPEARLLSTAFAESGYRTRGAGKLLHSRGGKSFGEYYGVSQRWSPLSKEAVKYTRKELPSKATANPRHLTKDSLRRKVVLPLNRMPSDRKPTLTDGESFDWGGWEQKEQQKGEQPLSSPTSSSSEAGEGKPKPPGKPPASSALLRCRAPPLGLAWMPTPPPPGQAQEEQEEQEPVLVLAVTCMDGSLTLAALHMDMDSSAGGTAGTRGAGDASSHRSGG